MKNIYTEKKLGQKRKAFIANPATLKYLDENGSEMKSEIEKK